MNLLIAIPLLHRATNQRQCSETPADTHSERAPPQDAFCLQLFREVLAVKTVS